MTTGKLVAEASHESLPKKRALAKNAEIVLAKIFSLQYIVFTFLIRYVGIRVALTTP
jgi:hypothetical protein